MLLFFFVYLLIYVFCILSYNIPAGRGPRSVMSVMSRPVFRFNRLRRLHPSGSCVSSSEKLMNFMHFHNSSTWNCNHHILLIMTCNAHKESCHKLLLILVREKGLHIIKTDCSDKLLVAFTIKEKNYLLVSLFFDVALPLSYLNFWY